MKNVLYLKEIKIIDNKFNCFLEYNGLWNKFIHENCFFAKYNVDITKVPNSIISIPVLCNLLPIMWINNLTIIVDELDSNFFNNIDNIKSGYEKMYPNIEFKGNLIVNKIVENKFNKRNCCVMFSGGVDAFNTLISHVNEKPDIITIFGADIDLNDKKGIDSVRKSNENIAKKFNLNYNDIFSNFRTVINYNEVNLIVKKFNYEWWHDFQHGIALLGLTAPVSYVNNYSTVYIASSFTSSEIGNYTCASDPTIDNYFCAASSKTIHDGYEFNRQDKIHNICKYIKATNESIFLRVCWQSKGGKNCCSCEKCYRTILAIVAENCNPIHYGFKITRFKRKKMMLFLKLHLIYNDDKMVKVRYLPIQNKFLQSTSDIPKDLIWITKIKVCSKKPTLLSKLLLKLLLLENKIIRKIKLFN